MIAATTTETLPVYLSSSEVPESAAAVVVFDHDLPRADVRIPLRPLSGQSQAEVWRSLPEDVHFGAVSAEEEGPLDEVAQALYTRVIEECRRSGYPYFLRMWNHVGSINDHDGGLERYQLFCAGRHNAFVAAGYSHRADLPAASAVGMPGRGIVTYYLAARRPGLQIENPRQVAAYDYPPQYGPKSPSFSRATLWKETLFVSGTSSVIGHESVHRHDPEAQLEETLRNIDAVIRRALPGGDLTNVVAAKTYVRYPEHYEQVARRLDDLFPSNLYLEADICRAELLLEIEAVALR